MDPKLVLCFSQKPTPPFPICSSLSYLHSSTLSPKTHLSLPSKSSQFMGKTLTFNEPMIVFPRPNNTHFPFRPITAAVKRRKEIPFDNVIQRDKKLKLVLKIRNILVNQPDRIMNLKDLGRFRRDLGLTRKRRFIALLKRFPAVFDIVEEGVYSLKFRLTQEAEQIYLEELRLRNEMEEKLVVKLRKLLMMSLEKQILLEKIAHLKADLGLPTEFRDTICKRYPQYFKVVSTERGPALELTHWDAELAVSAAELAEEEMKRREKEERDLIIDRPPRFRRVKLPKGLNLSKGEMRRLTTFNEIPYISPYSDFSELRPGSARKEKHACGVVHEMLSLTLEKRTLVDHLTHFREEFRFSQQLRGMLIRHPDMFYVSLKGDRDSVFLRDAYRNSQLVQKERILVLKEKMRELVAVPRFPRRPPARREGDEGGDEEEELEEGSEENDDWSVDDFLGNGSDDGEDDWSDDEEGDLPPDFDCDESPVSVSGGGKKAAVNGFTGNGAKSPVPVLPDGTPRERW